jgi:uncharacterized protein DUF1206
MLGQITHGGWRRRYGVTAGTQSVARVTDNRWVVLLGRVGLVGLGVVNLLIAWLATRVAFGDAGGSGGSGGSGGAGGGASKDGALQRIAAEPWGAVLLWVIAVCMVALALWQLGEAIWGRKSHGGPVKKVLHVVEALLFGVLGFSAGRVAASGKAQSNRQQAGLTAKVLDAPAGQVIVVVAGLVVIGAAAYLMVKGGKRKFLTDLDLSPASATTRKVTTRLGQVGYIALGVAYAIVGVLIVIAAVKHEPNKATGLDTALATLADQPFGTVLLLVVALGVACFGVYCFADARFRKP